MDVDGIILEEVIASVNSGKESARASECNINALAELISNLSSDFQLTRFATDCNNALHILDGTTVARTCQANRNANRERWRGDVVST